MHFLYRLLICLHPPAFRREFGAEMLWIFGEHRKVGAAAVLLNDALVSLLRQWFLRTHIWIAPLAMFGGLGLLLLTSIASQAARRAASFTSAPPNMFFMFAVVGSMCAIIPTLIFCVAWFQIARRRRHA